MDACNTLQKNGTETNFPLGHILITLLNRLETEKTNCCSFASGSFAHYAVYKTCFN